MTSSPFINVSSWELLMLRNLQSGLCILVSATAFSMASLAGVSNEEAARLGNDLTPFGSELKGNDKDIPDWTGGIQAPPKSYTAEGQFHPDPFPEDKPLLTITAQNRGQYKKYLSDGLMAMFEANPDSFKLPVYPTRRSHSMPQWVYDNTKKNAVSSSLTKGGNGIQGAYGGVPFPVLHGDNTAQALQAMWNHITRWRGIFVTRRSAEAVVQRNGTFSLVESQQEVFWNFFNPDGSEKDLDNVLFYYLSFITAPSRLSGDAILIHETLDQTQDLRQAWGYTAGTRRVKKAPNLAFDSPIVTGADNLRTADDTDMYNGSPERYNWRYVGLQEMYIPYNSYKIAQQGLQYAKIIGPNHVDPALTRFEKHRVHVVEAKLKKGQRHIYGKRVFYIDEDSWNIALIDQYDQRGELWRVSMAHLKNFYELPGVWTAIDVFYDLIDRRYHIQGLDTEESQTRVFASGAPGNVKRYFSAQGLRRQAKK
jgi:hypothetical protein